MTKTTAISILWLLAAWAAADATELLPQPRYANPESTRIYQVSSAATCHTYRFRSLFGGPQSLSILKIRWEPQLRWGAFFTGTPERRTAIAMAREIDALAAINASNFHFCTPPWPSHSLKAGGKLIVRYERPLPFHGYFGFKNGEFPEIDFMTAKVDFDRFDHLQHATFLLLKDGKLSPRLVPEDFGVGREAHPRTLVGIDRKNRLIYWIVADGRTDQARGLTFRDAITLLQDLGCDDALNLDGGGSSIMYLKEHGVISHPSDNNRFDHEGARPMVAIWYLK